MGWRTPLSGPPAGAVCTGNTPQRVGKFPLITMQGAGRGAAIEPASGSCLFAHQQYAAAAFTTGEIDMPDAVRERVVREPKLLLPFLRSFYDVVVPLAWPLTRLACGFHLIVHGWGKVVRGGAVTNSTLAFGIFLTFIEFAGGICITLGLFTRFFAAAVAIEMAYLTFVQYWSNGYGWRTDGYEYVLMWGMLAFAISLRGGGTYSLDRVIGREL
jgi:putative oxidoreductase